MQNAITVLNIIREQGQRSVPLQRIYRQLYNRDLYLRAYAKLYPNDGAMTPGTTPETVDAMTLAKIETIIAALRGERYRWTPVRRTYIKKKNGKRRPLGLPSWSDKVLQEVLRQLLDAYYEPRFSQHSHGFRPGRGCHTALQEMTHQWRGVKWYIEGDICSFFDRIDHAILLQILREQIHDNRFVRLIENLLRAGYLEQWRYNNTLSGVPQGGVVSPILSNLVLDKLDTYVEHSLIPNYTRGKRRKTYPPYIKLTKDAWKAKKQGDRETARQLNKQAQAIPSRDPNDPKFRRIWYCRYADDWLIGFTGPKAEAQEIKHQLAHFLQEKLKLELSEEKTLITHARSDVAHFLGYEIQTLQADDKHDRRGQRCINGSLGLRVPAEVVKAKCSRYLAKGKPIHHTQLINDTAYSIITQYQAEYRGVVQYYRFAYNLHQLTKLKRVMEVSLVKTLANKFKTSCGKIYQRFKTELTNEYGTYKVLEVRVERGPDKKPLVAYFGGIPLQWSKWGAVGETIEPIWSQRSEIVQRLLAEKCELCGATARLEAHHIRKLADLSKQGQPAKPEWAKRMVARRRKSLMVCQHCHNDIHAGRYDGPSFSNK
jgi:group II intron reverse transcriptase/maturase